MPIQIVRHLRDADYGAHLFPWHSVQRFDGERVKLNLFLAASPPPAPSLFIGSAGLIASPHPINYKTVIGLHKIPSGFGSAS